MGTSDTPPSHCPSWLVPTHTALLCIGVIFWDATYVLMTLRSKATRSYGMPLAALAINLGWEIVYAGYVTEMPLERVGFGVWLLLDVGLIWSTLRFGPRDWARSSPPVGRHIGWILGLLTVVSCLGQYTFAAWWLAEPGTGSGIKNGKWWRGREGYDTTELAFWSAAVSNLALSAGSIAMLLARGHSGGTSYSIWICRTLGTQFGLIYSPAILWWYWPEAHGFIVSPFAVFMWGTTSVCDLVYPLILWQVKQNERQLSDGTLDCPESWTYEHVNDVLESKKVD